MSVKSPRCSSTSGVVYGDDAPVLAVETAVAIAETLESASGREVSYLQISDAPPYAMTNGNLIIVGTAKSNDWVTKKNGATNVLTITGADSEAVEKAGMNFILSYWKNAKDSAARRVGLVTKELPKGGDAAKLP